MSEGNETYCTPCAYVRTGIRVIIKSREKRVNDLARAQTAGRKSQYRAEARAPAQSSCASWRAIFTPVGVAARPP